MPQLNVAYVMHRAILLDCGSVGVVRFVSAAMFQVQPCNSRSGQRCATWSTRGQADRGGGAAPQQRARAEAAQRPHQRREHEVQVISKSSSSAP